MSKSIVVDDKSTLIPEGNYELSFQYHETRIIFGPKVTLWFRVISPIDYAGLLVPCYYNVLEHVGPQLVNGDFRVGKKSKLVRDLIKLFGEVERLNEITIEKFNGVTVLAKVITVTQGSQKETIPKCLQYSRIGEFIELVSDNAQDSWESELHANDRRDDCEILDNF